MRWRAMPRCRAGDPGRRRPLSCPRHGGESLWLQRVVIVEFDSVDKTTAAHDSPGYQEALRVLGKAVDRDLRIVEGIE